MKEKINELLVTLGLKAVEIEQPIQLEQMKLEDGVTIIEADKFESGQAVNILAEDQSIPLPIGEYALEDGRVLVVKEEGIIFELMDKATEEETTPEGGTAPVAATQEVTPAAKRIIESIVKEHHFSKEEVDTLKDENQKLQDKVLELEKALDEKTTVDTIVPNPEPQEVNLSSLSKDESIVEFLNNRK